MFLEKCREVGDGNGQMTGHLLKRQTAVCSVDDKADRPLHDHGTARPLPHSRAGGASS